MNTLKICCIYIICLILIVTVCFPGKAQEADTLITSRIEEVTVDAVRTPDWKPVIKIDHRIIDNKDGVSIDELGNSLPSSKIQTNSRGESSIYIRGAGERQIMLFFDGVPLNTPWDNRIDLSLIPLEAVGEISVTRGIPSVTYGVNAISGVVNITSRTIDNSRYSGRFISRFGDNNSRYFSGMFSGGNNVLSYLVAGSHRTSEGFTLPGDFSHPDNPSNQRVNSGSDSFNLFSKVNYLYSRRGSLHISTLIIDSRKQVPPEIDVANPRYWRYPLWRRVGLAVSGKHTFRGTSASKIDYSISGTFLNAQIDQYKDSSFVEINDYENSKDIIFNGRAVYSGMISSTSFLRFVVAGFSTRHNEVILSEGNIARVYNQHCVSFGIEYEYFWKSISTLTGVSYDHSSIAVGDHNLLQNSIYDYSATAGIMYSINNSYSMNASVGRKTRFPTLRESFSGALGRFVANPDLKPETAYSMDAGFQGSHNRGRFDLIFFLTHLHDGIVRESLPEKKFRRINKDIIRTYGMELSYQNSMNDNISMLFRFTYLSALSKNEAGVFADTLEYKPQIMSSVYVLYSFRKNLESMMEINYTRKEYGLRHGIPSFEELPSYVLIHFRLGYTIGLSNKVSLEVFGRVNNIFDKLHYTQWGLPEAGRSFRGGASVEF